MEDGTASGSSKQESITQTSEFRFLQSVSDDEFPFYTVRFNEVTGSHEISGRRVDDIAMAVLQYRALDRRESRAKAEAALAAVGGRRSYHPIRENLADMGRAWRENAVGDPLRDLLGCIRSAEFQVWFPFWVHSAVRRAFTGVQCRMLVLAGPQGIGKSQLVRWLGAPFKGYTKEGDLEPSHPETQWRIASNFIWEATEFRSGDSHLEWNRLKEILGVEYLKYRPPWRRNYLEGPALACLIGTVNPKGAGGFLKDPTGYRRFFAATVPRGGIDWDYRWQDVARLWGQAVSNYWEHGDGVCDLTPYDDALWHTWASERYEIGDPIEDLIFSRIIHTGQDSDSVFAAAVMDNLERHLPGGRSKSNEMAIAVALQRLGAIPIRVGKNRQRAWGRVKWSE